MDQVIEQSVKDTENITPAEKTVTDNEPAATPEDSHEGDLKEIGKLSESPDDQFEALKKAGVFGEKPQEDPEPEAKEEASRAASDTQAEDKRRGKGSIL